MSIRTAIIRMFTLALCTACIIQTAQAAWPTDPSINVPVCAEINLQTNLIIVSDNSGGAIIAWFDMRTFQNPPPQGIGIYAQRIDADGNAVWTTDGIPVCAAADSRQEMQMIADGSGGAILCWRDSRSGAGPDIYAQRIDGSGTALWTANGIAVYAGSNYQSTPQLAPDGSGGAIIIWTDDRNSAFNFDIYAQRIDGSGTALWDSNGLPVCVAANSQYYTQIISDGSNGALVAWADGRRESGPFTQDTLQVYAQRINGSGTALWTINGVSVNPDAPPFQTSPLMVADGAGGAIISWIDVESDPNSDIFAQRIDASGAILWNSAGVAVCSNSDPQYSHQIVTNGSGGAIIAWADERVSPLSCDIFAQNIDASGTALWTANGIPLICMPTFDQRSPVLISDDAGGAIAAWQDTRNGGVGDVYAQRVNPEGLLQWNSEGQVISNASNNQSGIGLVSDQHFVSGAVIAWLDNRSGNSDIYTQHVNAHGRLGLPVAIFIQSFTARVADDGIELQWELTADEQIRGFKIFRAEASNPHTQLLEPGLLLPAHTTSYTDQTVENGISYLYTLSVVKEDGTETQSQPVRIVAPVLALSLEQNYPNPFNPITTITFAAPGTGRVNISIYDMKGGHIKTILDDPHAAGERKVTWDGTDRFGNQVASGIYLCRLRAGNRTITRKMALVR